MDYINIKKKPKNDKPKTEIQAIIFKKSYYTENKVNAWIKKHNYKPIKKIDITDDYLRVRLKPPKKNGKYRTMPITKTIKMIVEIKK